MKLVYFPTPEATQNNGAFIIGERINQWGKHNSWIVHYGTFDGAEQAIANKKPL